MLSIIKEKEIETPSEIRDFIIVGNGGSGTSLLRGLLNAHSNLHVVFEHKPPRLDEFIKEAKVHEGIWGNKTPIEQFISIGLTLEQMVEISDYFKIVHIIRRYSMYCKNRKGPYEKNWKISQDFYNAVRERHPSRVITVSFEDLLLRTESELTRICSFLTVNFQRKMLLGTNDTGYKRYNQSTINPKRV